MVDAPFMLVGVDGQPVDRQSTEYDRRDDRDLGAHCGRSDVTMELCE